MLNSSRRLSGPAIRVRAAQFFTLLLLLLLAGEFGQAQAAGITLVQHVAKDGGVTTSTSVAFSANNTAGNWIGVVVRAGSSSSQVFTVSDSNGNTYKRAGQVGFTASSVSLAIYYAENIKGGANTVTVSDTVSAPLRAAILEYSGVATSNSLDVAAAMATGTSTTPNSGNLTTTVSGDLLLGTVATADPETLTGGAGYTVRDFVPAEPNTKLVTEDQIQTSAGVASAGATLGASDAWGVVLAAFKPVGGVAGVPATITANAGTPQSATVGTAFAVQFQATVKDSFNNPVSGVAVTFAAPGSGASGTFAGGTATATTNASGVATAAIFTANNAAGAYTVTASVSGVSTPANFSLTNLPGAAASIAATAGTPQSATVNTAFATQLQVTVKDSFGNPVNNASVTFAVPGSGASGTFAGGVTTATTNASGVATAAIFTANTTAGAYLVTASVSGVGTSANFSLTNVAGGAATITATSGTPQSATVNTAFAVQLQATVKDSFNNPVSGVTVTFTAPASGASGAFAGGVKTATTNASGVATAAVFTANTTAGTYTVTASVSGVGTSATFSLTNLAGAAATIAATVGTPQSASINTAFATQLQATVRDSFGNPVGSVTVTFTAPGSGASGTFAGGNNSATTNASGVANAAVFTANGTAGGYTVTASASGVGTQASFSLTNLGNPPANIAATAGTPQSATINTAFAVQLQVTVTDSSNNPVSGATVTFAVPGSGASGTFAGGNNTATTNASGLATSAVFTANSIAGSYTVSATVSGVAAAANFSLTNSTGTAASVTATAGTPQSATVGTTYTTQFQVTVKDAGGNPVNAVTVTFAAPGSGASGTFAGGTTTATTNSSGVAAAVVFTANNTAGAYTVTASVSGVGTQASFSLTNLAGAAASIAATGGTPQSATVNTAFTTQLQATVTDSFNNPVNSATVTFAAPGSGASGTFAGGNNTATTNASGVATAAVFTANSTVGGPYTVTASVSGVGTSASFSLSNTASVAANIALVQHTGKDAGVTSSTSVAFSANNTAGNWIGVVVRAGSSSSQVFTVSDSNGNTYKRAGQVGFTASSVSLAIYYAENIKGGANTVTVSDTVSAPLRAAISEYSGIATSNSLDVAAATATGTSTTPNSGNLTPTASGDLLLGAVGTVNAGSFTAGSGYTIRDSVPAEPNTKLVTEDQIQAAAGAASAGATLAASDTWGVVLAAFKPAVGGGGAGPTITSLSQTSGAVGVSITITGTNFGSAQGTVTFNGTQANVSNWTATSIVTSVPSNATSGPVVVTAGGVQSNGVTFTVVPPPSISGISPASGPFGTAVTISGANFGSSQGSSTVTLSGLNAGTATTWTASSIAIPVPNGAMSGPVVVTVLGTSSNGVTFTVTSAGPSISSLSLTQGPVGATFTVNGANFGSAQGSSTVTLGGTSISASNWTANSFNVTVPSGASSGPVVVTVGGVQSNGVTFTVTPPPGITSIAPTSGPVGTNVVITGTNFGPTVGTIQSFVTFNGIQTRASNWSNTSITAPVPASATTGSVLVYVGGVPSNAVTFTVTPPPSITSLSPNFGPVGTSVTITGANFGSTQGTSTVTFNNTSAVPTSWIASSIVVPVPSGATSGNVVVTESGVPSNSVNFTVTTGSGNISLVQHRSLDAGSTTSGSLAFNSSNTAGNWIAVAVRAGSTGSETFTISDTSGNTYQQAYQFATSNTALVFALYYAENIKGGTNTISVSDTVSGPLRFAIFEYSGVATSNSLDAIPVISQGSSTTANSGNLTTGASGDLLLGTVVTPNFDTFTAGSGYVIEEFVPNSSGAKLIVEDQMQAASGAASATATISPADGWGAGLAAFRSISGQALPITVSVSPTSASVPTGYGTQGFTATVQNDFQNRGVTWSVSGAGCSGVTCGTLSKITATSVMYTAPGNLPSPATVTLTATSIGDNTKSASATITVTQGVLTVILSPKRAAVTMSASQTVQFTANVYNDPSNSGVTWQVDGNNGGSAASGTITNSGLYTPGTQPGAHTVAAFSNANASVGGSALMAVTDLAGVYKYHNDNSGTGQNVKEYGLSPATVTPATFGQLFSCPVDGVVYAQPLWVGNLNFGGTIRNAVFVATEHNSVYAFDADSLACLQLWKVSFINPPNVDVLTPAADVHGNGDIVPELGITSTPVIDPATNTLYVVPNTREIVGTVNGQACSSASPCYPYRLHALDLTTGAEKVNFNSPVVISAANFDSHQHLQRPALLLANSTVYIAFGSHGDSNPYYGWLMGYDPATLAQKFATAFSTGGSNRAGIWQAGAGPVADSSGNIYFSTGNGFYDGNTNFGDTALKVGPMGSLPPVDWFTPFNQSTFNANDIDLASGGILILPSSVGSTAHPNLAIATGKVAILYLLDIGTCTPIPPASNCTTMGKFNSSSNNDVQEVVPVPPPNTTLLDGGNYAVPAYWNGNIYTTGQSFPLSHFTIANGVIATPQASSSTNMFPPRGGVPAVSANGTTGGVVWIIDYTGWQNGTPAILDAYDATNVGTLLYGSAASGAGSAAPAVKFTTPTVANGKVYVGGQLAFTVFGLLPN